MATASLLGFAASRNQERGGLAALTVAACLVDDRHGGYGWPTEFGTGSGPAATVLVVAAAALLALAVLGRVRTGVSRRLLPAALAGLAMLVLVAELAGDQERSIWHPVAVVAVLLPPATAVILVLLAANAAIVAGRRHLPAAAGLFAVLVLAFGAVAAAGASDLVRGESELVAFDYPHGIAHRSGTGSELREYVADVPLAVASVEWVSAARESQESWWRANVWPVDGPRFAGWAAFEAAALLLGLAALVRSLSRPAR